MLFVHLNSAVLETSFFPFGTGCGPVGRQNAPQGLSASAVYSEIAIHWLEQLTISGMQGNGR